jgi:hypothetical protein
MLRLFLTEVVYKTEFGERRILQFLTENQRDETRERVLSASVLLSKITSQRVLISLYFSLAFDSILSLSAWAHL